MCKIIGDLEEVDYLVSLKPVFVENAIFPPTSNHPKFVLHAQIDVPNMSMKKIWKNVSYNAPLGIDRCFDQSV